MQTGGPVAGNSVGNSSKPQQALRQIPAKVAGISLFEEEELDAIEAEAAEVAKEDRGSLGTQTAAVLGSVAGLLGTAGDSCSTKAASWPWYAWLGMIWLWLIALWIGLAYLAEPILGEKQYSRRLATVIGCGTGLGLGLWWIISPCYTNIWVPVTVAVMGIALYWLYSEDADIPNAQTPSQFTHKNSQRTQ